MHHNMTKHANINANPIPKRMTVYRKNLSFFNPSKSSSMTAFIKSSLEIKKNTLQVSHNIFGIKKI